jgi:hypothetical protein
MSVLASVRSTYFSFIRSSLAVAVLATAAAQAGAQASLGSQGFGYPPGQLSTRAAASGASVAEMDPWSPINPAAIGVLSTRLLFFQVEPEFRTIQTAAGDDRTTTARYPIVFGAIPIGQRWVVGVGASTLLDRSSATRSVATQIIGGDTVDVTTTFRVTGAVNDLRLAGAWSPTTWIRVGAGLHGFTGRNLVDLTESFSDSTTFSSFNLQRNLSFSGGAFSAGAQLFTKSVLGAVSWRHGGTMRIGSGDTTLASANVPDRFGASLAYIGIANSAIAVRTSHENWSALAGLGSPGFQAVDSWDTSVGADVAGPRVVGRQVMLRAGFRSRTLPFQAGGNDVTERSVTAGAGTMWAAGHVITDVAVIRAMRSAGLSTSEKAWTISLGISIRQ